MPASPSPYTPAYNFTSFQTNNPNTPLPAGPVDNEFANISTIIAEIEAFQLAIQNSNGTLGSGVVTPTSLSTQTLAMLTAGATFVGVWVTGHSYTLGQCVSENGLLYVCLVAHTSGVFATDLASGYWVALTQATTMARVDVASAATTLIGAASGYYVRITGTTTISGFDTGIASGVVRDIIFQSSLTLQSGANLILPTGQNIQTSAGDTCRAYSEGSNVWRVVDYQTASGNSLTRFAGSSSSAANTYTATLSPAPAAYLTYMEVALTFTNATNSLMQLSTAPAMRLRLP